MSESPSRDNPTPNDVRTAAGVVAAYARGDTAGLSVLIVDAVQAGRAVQLVTGVLSVVGNCYPGLRTPDGVAYVQEIARRLAEDDR